MPIIEFNNSVVYYFTLSLDQEVTWGMTDTRVWKYSELGFFFSLHVRKLHLWSLQQSFNDSQLWDVLLQYENLHLVIFSSSLSLPHYYFTTCKFFIPILIGGFSLEPEWQQVSSGFSDYSKYSSLY